MFNFEELHPSIREKAKKFISDARAHDIDLRITFGFRSFEKQNELYNQEHDGKDNDGNGIIDDRHEHVTNAKGGQSFHNYGLAIDVIPFIDGKPDWNTKKWPVISLLGKNLGFAWGGEWRSFKDLPHFEYPPGKSYKDLARLVKNKEMDENGFIKLEKL